MTISINAAFDSGNIVVDSVDGTSARLSIRKDRESDFYQWFHFRVACNVGDELDLAIGGLAASAYPDGWPGYAVCASTDREHWFRLDTAKEKPQEGEVVAVGTGSKAEDGKVTPLDVKAGDRILFGKWSGTEVKVDGEELLIMKESDILGVLA